MKNFVKSIFFYKVIGLTILIFSQFFVSLSFAHPKNSLILRAGIVNVDPQENSTRIGNISGTGAGLDSDTELGLTATYMLLDHVGIGLLAATPLPQMRQ